MGAMKKLEILPGERYGKLTIVEEVEPVGKLRRFKCLCECGRETTVRLSNLRGGVTKSCGHTRGNTLRQRAGFYQPGHQARNYIFLNYMAKAKLRGRVWEIDFERFCEITSQDCFYCGSPPSNRTRDKNGDGVFVYNGIDRIDPSRGYTEDNIVPACIVCNRAKTDMSMDEFLAWVKRLASVTLKGGD
jgi:hypothetical protein